SRSAVAAQLGSQLTHTGPLVTAVHSLFDASDPVRCESKRRKLTEFFANLRLLIRPLKIAPGALTRVCALSPVLEGYCYTRRLEAWGDSGHLRGFRHMHVMAKSPDGRVVPES